MKTTVRCTQCGSEHGAVLVLRDDGYALLCECGMDKIIPDPSWSIRSEKAKLELALRAKRNWLVWQMGHCFAEEVGRSLSWDPTGPGETPLNRLSYEIAVIDHKLADAGLPV